MVPPVVSNIVSSVTPSVSVTPTIPSQAKGLNALLGLPTPSADIFPPGTHASVPQLGRNIIELGNKDTQLGDKATGGDKSETDNQEEAVVSQEGGLADNGTENFEIAEVVDEEGGENQVMIITETKTDGQVSVQLP